MNTDGNDRLREMLAAEYALGTLRGGARRRFERWMRNDPALAALSLAWSERLTPLIDAVVARTPPPRVWRAIEARLPGISRSRPAPPAPIGWWERLGFWRGMSAAFAVIAASALTFALRPASPPRTEIVQVETLPSAVANVTDPKSGALVAVVIASRAGDELIIKVAADVSVAEGQVLQLWAAPKEGTGLLSMGTLPGARTGEPIRLKTVDAATVNGAKAFGISLEPSGGSPQPTRVLGLGGLVRLSS